MVKAALYCRVSREDLKNENQLQILQARAEMENWEVTLFQEEESTRKTRPIKVGMINRLRSGEFQILAFTRVDRFARSTTEIITDVSHLVEIGVRVVVVQQGLDLQKNSYDASTRAHVGFLAVMAEFERDVIRERTMEGLARARSQGRIGGRPRKNKPPLVLRELFRVGEQMK